METTEATTTYRDELRGILATTRLPELLEESRRLREAHEAPERRKAPDKAQRPQARSCIDPPARMHRMLRRAYLHVTIIDRSNGTGAILERAALYASHHQRVVCRRCDGIGIVSPTDDELEDWDRRIAPLLAFYREPEIEKLLGAERPDDKTCPRCDGAGTQRSWDGTLSARPSGSSVPVGSPAVDPADIVTVARMGRVTRRVAQTSRLHAIALEAYYGDTLTLSPLAAAHGRLLALYPLTETGRSILEARDDWRDPWDALCTHMTRPEQSDGADDASMSREAYALLLEATETWDNAIETELPNWEDEP